MPPILDDQAGCIVRKLYTFKGYLKLPEGKNMENAKPRLQTIKPKIETT